MQLWNYWWEAIRLLKPVFSRSRTFMWFTACVVGFSVRTDKLGVTSIVRALGLDAKYYDNLLDSFHSAGVKLDDLSATWANPSLTLISIIPFGKSVLQIPKWLLWHYKFFLSHPKRLISQGNSRMI